LLGEGDIHRDEHLLGDVRTLQGPGLLQGDRFFSPKWLAAYSAGLELEALAYLRELERFFVNGFLKLCDSFQLRNEISDYPDYGLDSEEGGDETHNLTAEPVEQAAHDAELLIGVIGCGPGLLLAFCGLLTRLPAGLACGDESSVLIAEPFGRLVGLGRRLTLAFGDLAAEVLGGLAGAIQIGLGLLGPGCL